MTPAREFPSFTVGDRLRKAREAMGLSQGEFAERIGVSRKTLSGYEIGRIEPRLLVLRSVAMATGFTVDQLLGREGHPPSPDGGLISRESSSA